MSLDGFSNLTDSVFSNSFQNCMQTSSKNAVLLGAPEMRTRHEICETVVGSSAFPMLDLAEFASLNFLDVKVSMCSPADAFKLRASGRLSAGGDLQTLHSYLTHPNFMAGEVHPSLRAKAAKIPQPNTVITVYCTTGDDEMTQYGVVMPGSFVALSKSLARLMVNASPNSQLQMNWSSVYPDELMYQGAPYGFVYVPRSLPIAFDRYQKDLGHMQVKEHSKIRKFMRLLDTKLPQHPPSASGRN